MSGGSWEYAYLKVEDWADTLKQSDVPLRGALGRRLDLLAVAMQDIEWVDSGDTGPGDEKAAIRKFLGGNSAKLEMDELVLQAKVLKHKIDEAVEDMREEMERGEE